MADEALPLTEPLAAAADAAVAKALEPLKLDFGCGANKRAGFRGVDAIGFPGVDIVFDVVAREPDGAFRPWPWADGAVDEAHASHFLEHLDARERVHFFNELYRVLRPGGQCTIITPHWASNRAYGDPTHKWPPVSEMAFYYLSREWRVGDPAKGVQANAPHTDAGNNPDGFRCDFAATWGYALHPLINLKAGEAQQFAIQFYKEAAQDTVATLTARK